MAQVIKIEIPVEVTDNTEPALSGISGKLSKMEQAMQKLDKMMKSFGKSKMEQRLDDEAERATAAMEDEAEQISKMTVHPEIEVEDHATEVINDIKDRLSDIEGSAVDAEIGAADNATSVISAAEDAVEAFDGQIGYAELGADDSATMIIRSAEDAVEMFDSSAAWAEINAADNATSVISATEDAVEAFGGLSAAADVGANDNASGIIDAVRDKLSAIGGYAVSAVVGAVDTASAVIDSVTDKASAWAGTAWNATVGIVDAATAPLQGIANMVKSPITQAGTMLGITVGLNDTVNTFKDFESMMSQVSAISGATGSEFDALTAKAKEMGANTKFTAAESAEAFNYMAMAGWKTSDMLGGIEGIMNLAAASGESLGSTSDIVTDALTAFGLSASDSGHFADVLAQASANANTNVGMLGESFKYVAPVAGAMKYSIEDASLALGLMASANIKGSMAGTALKTSLANMASPTDSMAEAMEKYGISLTDTEGNMKSLRGVMENLRTSLGSLSETEQIAAASTIFGKEAMAGMLAIINASEADWDKLTAAVDNADGAAQRMSDTMLDNLQGSLTLMQSAVDGVKISFGERLSPYIRGVADAITESMPAAETALTKFMDTFDRKIDNMVTSEAWADAGLFGKVNIAWNTMIGEPFLEWAKSEGGHVISEGFGTLFSEAAKVLPGGEEAGIASWLSLGLLAKGTTTAVNGVRKLSSVLGDFSPAAGKFGVAAAAVTAGVAAIAMAVDNYNQKRIDESLTDHFGNITLSAKQIEDAASMILDAKYLVNVDLALNEIKNADEMRDKAEAALEANDVLEWKSMVGITLTADEQQEYTENIETFIESKIDELESRSFAAHLQVQTFLGGTEEGQTLDTAIEKWARADTLELNGLANDLKTAVENAFKDGVMGVEEEAAISELQNKINNITSRWKEAEAQAQMDWINQEFGSLSGKDLDSGSFVSLVEALREQRQLEYEKIEADAKDFYRTLNGNAGRLGPENGLLTAEDYKDMAGQAIRNQKAQNLLNSLNSETNTLEGTYGSKIAENIEKSREAVQQQVQQAQGDLAAGLLGVLPTDIMSGAESALTKTPLLANTQSKADQKALAGLWESMKPDADAMTSLIDEYAATGQKVPRQVMEAFNQQMEIGAAAGDMDAAWQVYANAFAQSGDDALINAINDMAAQGQLPEEFAAAWKRAMLEVTDETQTLEGLQAQVEGDVTVDKDEWLGKINENLGDLGKVTASTEAEIEVTVDKGDTLSEIAEALGMDWHELAEYNGLEDPYTIYPDMTIKVPRDQIETDTSGIQEAAEEAAEEATEEPVKTEQPVNTTYTQGETDASQIEEQAQEDIEKEAIKAEQPVDTKYTQGEVDDSELQESAQEPEDKEPVSADYPVDITYILGETNTESVLAEAKAEVIDAFSTPVPADGDVSLTMTHANSAGEVGRIYGEVDSEVKGKFGTGFTASADVAVTLNWSIVNPTASISVGGAGTGSALVSASLHAEGGLFGAPHLGVVAEDGPEAIIPLGGKRRSRGIELWQQAGEMLGVPMHAEGGIFSGSSLGTSRKYLSDDSEDNENTQEGKIDVTVPDSERGNVTIQVSLSPEFKISNESPANIMQMIKSQLKEMTDDLAYTLAEKLEDSFANTPI